MKKVNVNHYDAFTTTAGKGNPAGVIVKAEQYTTEEMQETAKEIGFSECAFILPSKLADFRLRYFTPGTEVNLCGHATIASIYAMYNKTPHDAPAISQKVETKAGIIDIAYQPSSKEVMMSQADAEFLSFEGNKQLLAESIGLSLSDLDEEYPIVYGSTGLWTVIMPIKTLEAFSRMKPDHTKFASLLRKKPNASLHPICTQTLKKDTDLHGRHFSPEETGRIEDPITGTACGVMGAYYIAYMQPEKTECDIRIEQGQDAGYDGIVHVWAKKEAEKINVNIAGTAVKVKEMVAHI